MHELRERTKPWGWGWGGVEGGTEVTFLQLGWTGEDGHAPIKKQRTGRGTVEVKRLLVTVLTQKQQQKTKMMCGRRTHKMTDGEREADETDGRTDRQTREREKG